MNSNEYMNDYMKRRWNLRRVRGIMFLGSKCELCGSQEDLEFDHIDRKTKSFTLGKMSSCSEYVFWNEILKCQLLCKKCHTEKSKQESSDFRHGTWGTYKNRGCRCDICKDLFNTWHREYRRKLRDRSLTEKAPLF